MHTTETRNHMMSTRTMKNDVYLIAIINSQEQEIQKLQAINNELKIKLSKYNASFCALYILNNKL